MESYRTRLDPVSASLSKPQISGKFNVCRRAATMTAYSVVSDLTCTIYQVQQTNRCGWLRFIPMSDFTVGPSSRKIQWQNFPCENNGIYFCYYKTDNCYSLRTFSIDLCYCVTQMYHAKIQLSVKYTSLSYLQGFSFSCSFALKGL
jgi:hypothetical protein